MRDRPAARPHTLRTHLRETLRLALPVMLARLGVLTIVTMDTAMSGHASGDDLAWYAVAIAPQIPLMLVGIGLLMGTIVMTAQAVGAGNPERCGAIWRTALVHAAVAGAAMAVACTFGESFLARDRTARGHRGRRRPRPDGARIRTPRDAAVRGDRLLSRRHRPPGSGDGDHHRCERAERRPELAAGLRPRRISGPGRRGRRDRDEHRPLVHVRRCRAVRAPKPRPPALRHHRRERSGRTSRPAHAPDRMADGDCARAGSERIRGDDPHRRLARRRRGRRLLDPDEPPRSHVHGRHRARHRGQRPGRKRGGPRRSGRGALGRMGRGRGGCGLSGGGRGGCSSLHRPGSRHCTRPMRRCSRSPCR